MSSSKLVNVPDELTELEYLKRLEEPCSYWPLSDEHQGGLLLSKFSFLFKSLNKSNKSIIFHVFQGFFSGLKFQYLPQKEFLKRKSQALQLEKLSTKVFFYFSFKLYFLFRCLLVYIPSNSLAKLFIIHIRIIEVQSVIKGINRSFSNWKSWSDWFFQRVEI